MFLKLVVKLKKIKRKMVVQKKVNYLWLFKLYFNILNKIISVVLKLTHFCKKIIFKPI